MCYIFPVRAYKIGGTFSAPFQFKMSLTKVDSLNTANKIVGETAFFAKHETFHPRYGWLKKGFDAVAKRNDMFSLADSHILLGVGRNMASAIKYWCSAFKVISPVRTDEHRAVGYYPTEFGKLLLTNAGWDPWLENPASLWLLHWHLLKTPSRATAWHFVFNQSRKTEFTEQDLRSELARFCIQSNLSVADSSLHKDLLCILRMYAGQNDDESPKNFAGDDSLACPFVELNLIQQTNDSRYYQFRHGAKANLPPEVIVAAALDYAALLAPGQKTISTSNLLYQPGSPGLIFKLTESALCAAIEEVSRKHDVITLTDSAGLVQLSFDGDPHLLTQMILNDYYA